jgi:O-antigen/teichoic acid export membrane protein
VKRFFRVSVPLLLGVGGSQVALLITGVLTARFLGVEGRGSLATAMLVPTLFSFAAGLSMGNITAVLVGHGHARSSVLRSSAMAVLIPATAGSLAAGACLIALGFSFSLASMATIAVIPLVYTPIALGLCTGSGNFWRSGILQMASPVAYAALLVLGISIAEASVELVMGLWVVALVLSCGIGFILAKSIQIFQDDGVPSPRPVDLLRRGLKGVFATHSPLESFRIDQVAVLAILSTSSLGLYSVGLALANLPKLAGQTAAWTIPRLTRDPRVDLRRTITGLLVLLLGAGTAFAFCTPWLVVLLFGEEFSESSSLALVLTIAGTFMAARKVLVELMRARGREQRATNAELFATALFVIAVLPATLAFGLMGVAWSLLAAAALSTTITYVNFALSEKR